MKRVSIQVDYVPADYREGFWHGAVLSLLVLGVVVCLFH